MITSCLDVNIVYALQTHGNMNTNKISSIIKAEKKKPLIISTPP